MVRAAMRRDHDAMVATSLTRLAGAVARRRTRVGSCAACGVSVFEDERHLRIHDALLHQLCATYRRR
jgi:hypothetical protein